MVAPQIVRRAEGPRRNGDVSFWYAGLGVPEPRDPLPGDRAADVCIVGGGFTGLWTAYELKRAQPALDVVVLEAEFAGFGASGRNGGWLSNSFAAAPAAVARMHGRAGVHALHRAMKDTVDEVIAVCARERIEADIVKGGMLHVARNPAQLRRVHAHVAEERAWDVDEHDLAALDGPALAERVRVAGGVGATWSPHAARVQPAKLVRGLADAVERLGVPIYERTRVREIRPGAALTDRGTVRARHVLRCLEGFTAGLAGERRTWLPLNSAMVVTEPLSDAAWEEIGWEGAEVLGDSAHAYVYAQRTADGRIALGGRGVPYRFGSRWDERGATQPRTIAQLTAALHARFPATRSAALEHAWCGVLGVPRDWFPAVRLDPATGLGAAGGYVGHGVATSNLAGRTLCDLVLGRESELTRLPWVGHRARRWEPEPLRWIGARAVYGLYRAADRREATSGRPRTSALARAADLLSGR
ncbi:MAG TPA: FAD-binding oxidoreductase [Conexibacter sp.]|nr:FAD-binding oxidoreductase [Conexibacter sp.]